MICNFCRKTKFNFTWEKASELWLPIIFSLCLILGVELAIQAIKKPGFWEKSTWLLHDPYRGEQFDRLITFEKLKALEVVKPEIISVGDSSGFFSIRPNIVNHNLRGLKYFSLSTGANQAFAGYKGIAEFAIKNNPQIKHVVLNMHPPLLPSPRLFANADLAPILYDNLIGFRSCVTPPSASLSPYAKNLFFYRSKYNPEALLSTHKVYLERHHSIQQSLGWVPEHDIRFDRVAQLTPFYNDSEKNAENMWGIFERSSIMDTLDDFAKMCRKYHVRLYIMFNPMSWSAIVNDENLRIAEKKLVEFQQRNSDVIFLTQQLVNPWEPAKFGMFNHISRDCVHESSVRMGKALEKAIYMPESIPPFHPAWEAQKFSVPRNIKLISPATADQKGAALAYFLYTATFDLKYEKQISKRVLTELHRNTGFQLLKDDEKARLDYLAKKKISLDYDSSQIKAEVVSLENGYHPGGVDNVEWIRLSGIMQFGLHSATHNVSEPVNWPEGSNIIIPIIREADGYKFDGYFPSSVE
jgi:hypothetical protein